MECPHLKTQPRGLGGGGRRLSDASSRAQRHFHSRQGHSGTLLRIHVLVPAALRTPRPPPSQSTPGLKHRVCPAPWSSFVMGGSEPLWFLLRRSWVQRKAPRSTRLTRQRGWGPVSSRAGGHGRDKGGVDCVWALGRGAHPWPPGPEWGCGCGGRGEAGKQGGHPGAGLWGRSRTQGQGRALLVLTQLPPAAHRGPGPGRRRFEAESPILCTWSPTDRSLLCPETSMRGQSPRPEQSRAWGSVGPGLPLLGAPRTRSCGPRGSATAVPPLTWHVT